MQPWKVNFSDLFGICCKHGKTESFSGEERPKTYIEYIVGDTGMFVKLISDLQGEKSQN